MTVSSSIDPCSVKQTRTLLVIRTHSLFLQEASYEYAQFTILEVVADSARRGQQNITALIQDSQLWIFFYQEKNQSRQGLGTYSKNVLMLDTI